MTTEWEERSSECFHCAELYRIVESDAPSDFIETYCSQRCYDADMRLYQRDKAAEQKGDIMRDEGKNFTPFRMKIPR